VPKRVMIVDDDRDLREMLRTALELAGYDAQVAANGLKLVSSLRVDRPDLILLDVMMSWIDGFELCHALKQNPEFAKIPVFFISARGSRRDIEKGHEAGCSDYFTKPLNLKFLVERIRQVIGAP
jgi:DNA-binding response OmpR family regulator